MPPVGEQEVGRARPGDRALLPCSERLGRSSRDTGLAAPACLRPQHAAAAAVRVSDCPGETERGGGGMEEKKAVTEAVFLPIPE